MQLGLLGYRYSNHINLYNIICVCYSLRSFRECKPSERRWQEFRVHLHSGSTHVIVLPLWHLGRLSMQDKFWHLTHFSSIFMKNVNGKFYSTDPSPHRPRGGCLISRCHRNQSLHVNDTWPMHQSQATTWINELKQNQPLSCRKFWF